jgi:hypothetical protein
MLRPIGLPELVVVAVFIVVLVAGLHFLYGRSDQN